MDSLAQDKVGMKNWLGPKTHINPGVGPQNLNWDSLVSRTASVTISKRQRQRGSEDRSIGCSEHWSPRRSSALWFYRYQAARKYSGKTPTLEINVEGQGRLRLSKPGSQVSFSRTHYRSSSSCLQHPQVSKTPDLLLVSGFHMLT